MSTFKTKNGTFATYGALEKAGLAVALNIENFLFKVNKFQSESWQNETADLISKNIHTVLAQCDQDERYPARMLNSGGILTFINDQSNPLGMVLLYEKGGLTLGFGKVELRDLDPHLTDIQKKLDDALKGILLDLLHESKNKEDFASKVKSNELCKQFSALEKILVDNDKQVKEIVSSLSINKDLQGQESSFDRPPLNKYTVKAIRAAAIREITEEINLEMNGSALSADQLKTQEALNREQATKYVRSILAIQDTSKFSAKEFNNDFESSTFIVTCPVDNKAFEEIKFEQSCKLVQPNEVQIKIINPEKGMLQTSLSGYPPILGGGNQFTVALYCLNVFNNHAVFIPAEISSPSTIPAMLFPVDKSPTEKTDISSSSLNKNKFN